MAAPEYDCTRCGACCFNPDENRAEGYTEYLPVLERDVLRKRTDLMTKLTFSNERGEVHLRLAKSDQRCVALRGALGHKIACTIYEWRPAACRKLEAGSDRCLQYRKERGVR